MRASAPALVENDDAVMIGIEAKRCARAGTAMQQHNRHAIRIAALLPVKIVNVIDREKAAGIGAGAGNKSISGARRLCSYFLSACGFLAIIK